MANEGGSPMSRTSKTGYCMVCRAINHPAIPSHAETSQAGAHPVDLGLANDGRRTAAQPLIVFCQPFVVAMWLLGAVSMLENWA